MQGAVIGCSAVLNTARSKSAPRREETRRGERDEPPHLAFGAVVR